VPKEEENLLRSVVRDKPIHFPDEEAPSKIETTKIESKVEQSQFDSSKLAQKSLAEADRE
jgi:hypothetical protein